MEELIKSGVLTIQLGIIEARCLMYEDPEAAAEMLEQADSLCEEAVEALKTLTEIRETEEATAEIRAETARIEKQTRWIQIISLVAATAALVANAVMIACRLW